jgi:hypothetical protein
MNGALRPLAKPAAELDMLSWGDDLIAKHQHTADVELCRSQPVENFVADRVSEIETEHLRPTGR